MNKVYQLILILFLISYSTQSQTRSPESCQPEIYFNVYDGEGAYYDITATRYNNEPVFDGDDRLTNDYNIANENFQSPMNAWSEHQGFDLDVSWKLDEGCQNEVIGKGKYKIEIKRDSQLEAWFYINFLTYLDPTITGFQDMKFYIKASLSGIYEIKHEYWVLRNNVWVPEYDYISNGEEVKYWEQQEQQQDLSHFFDVSETLTHDLSIPNNSWEFDDDLIVNTSYQLSVSEGATLTFQNNAQLKVYGTLNVNGTYGSGNGVIFDFVSKGSSNGIKIYSGGTADIEYAEIKNAYYGVNIYNSSSTVKNCKISDCNYGIITYYNSPNIETNEIYDCSINGIYLYQGSPTITDNYIHDITSFGLKVNGATNTYIRDNTIEDCMGGIHAYGNQTIKLNGYGQNKIEGYASNGYAVLVTGGTAHLGEYSSQGKNSFIRISPYKVIYNSTSNEILAEKNYWGLPIPTSSTQSDFFYGDVEWSFPYSSPPGGVGSTLGKEIIPEQTPDRVLFVEATELADLNDHKEASNKFKKLVKDYPDSRFAGLSVAWAMTSDIEEKEFKNQKSYLELLKKHKNKKVRDNSLLWLATLESKAGNKEAVTEIVNSTSINEAVGVELRLNWANDLLNMYDDENGAEAIFDELTSTGASEGALSTIDAIKTTALSLEGVELPEKFGKSNNNLVETVVNESKLNASYPNPFNPSTTISYQLQQKSNVNLVVYNSIGQEVAVLVNQQKDQGIHNVDFNASNLPSGLYIYRLQVQTPDGKGNISEARKMILMK